MTSQSLWLGIGFLEQAMFSGRFLVQWLISEERRESVVPLAFWWFSIAGGVTFPHGLHNHPEAGLARQRRHARGPGLVPPQPGHTFVEIPLLPAPDRGLGGLGAPHDLTGSAAVRCRQHDAGAPDDLAGSVAVRDQRFQPGSIRRAKIKADVIASHGHTMTDSEPNGNHLSGG